MKEKWRSPSLPASSASLSSERDGCPVPAAVLQNGTGRQGPQSLAWVVGDGGAPTRTRRCLQSCASQTLWCQDPIMLVNIKTEKLKTGFINSFKSKNHKPITC